MFTRRWLAAALGLVCLASSMALRADEPQYRELPPVEESDNVLELLGIVPAQAIEELAQSFLPVPAALKSSATNKETNDHKAANPKTAADKKKADEQAKKAAGEAAAKKAATIDVTPLAELTIDIAPPTGKLPTEHDAPVLMGDSGSLVRAWPANGYHWVAANSRHYPLYFEEINAERYGYICGPCCLQPVTSAAHFFGSALLLPYQMGAHCPQECQYTLGHYRPGDCNPWRVHHCPWSVRGAALQTAAVFGVAALP